MSTDTTPTPQELAEAIKALSEELNVTAQAPKDWRVQLRRRHASTLLAHARAPRLTEAQREAVTAFEAGEEDYDQRCLILGILRRAAFPEIEQGGGE